MASDVAIRIHFICIKSAAARSTLPCTLQKAIHLLYLAALITKHGHHSSRGPARRCLMSNDGVSGFSQDG
jgi:hypothetical protein